MGAHHEKQMGLFITLEGGEGSGKSTQARMLRDYLVADGQDVVLTREPGGTPEAEKIRDLITQREGGDWTPIAEILLFFAARQMHVESLIKPALAAGKFVICDRFTDSTRAYQGYGHGFALDKIEELNQFALAGFEPDLTFIMDIDVDAGLQRSFSHKSQSNGLEATEDRFERFDKFFHERMRHGFQEIAKKDPERCRLIDASRSQDAIFADLKSHLESFMRHAV